MNENEEELITKNFLDQCFYTIFRWQEDESLRAGSHLQAPIYMDVVYVLKIDNETGDIDFVL